jgi:hypothetical protein
MIRVVHHLLRDERRRPHAFDARHRPGALARPVHARRVELDDAVGVRQPAVADARIFGIELDDVDARDQRIEDVLAFRHHAEGRLDTGLRAAILEAVAVGRSDDHRLHAARSHHGRRLCRSPRRRRHQPRRGARQDEFASIDSGH